MDIEESPEGRVSYREQTRNRRHSTQRLVLITIVCSILLSLIFTISYFSATNDTKSADVCLTPECIQEAATTLEFIDTDVNPCDDFYKFSCGNYLKTKRIPDNEMIVSVLGDIDDKYREQLRAIIDYNIFPSNVSPFSILHTFYENCMDKNGIEKIGLRTISKIFKDLGGWPVVEGDSWSSNNSWVDTIGSFIKRGFSTEYLFQFGNGVNFTNTNQHLYYIDHPKLGLSTPFLIREFNDTFVRAYYKYMIDVAVLLGANKTRAQKEMRDLMEFHIELAKSFKSPEDQRNISLYNNPMTMSEIEEKYGNIPWNDYFLKVFQNAISLKKDDVLLVYDPPYLSKLNNILQKTDERTLINFIFWRSIESVVKYLPGVVREAELNFKIVREGILETSPRWKECIDNSIELIDPIVTFVYYQTYFNQTILNQTIAQSTKTLVHQIHQEFLNMLEKLDWMDEKTKEKALEKARAMNMQIADENKVQSLERLKIKYKSLKLKSDGDYLQSYLSIPKAEQEMSNVNNSENEHQKLKFLTVEGPALLNPTYSLFQNQIYIPAGILQDPFMNDKRPQYINYANLGFVVGHEITHGFGDQGHEFDKSGHFYDWWDKTTKQQFIEKTKCLVYQYGNFSKDEIGEKLNGIVSLGENMADNGGIKVSHIAYKKWIKENGPEKKLPGLDYTPWQLFWIKLAQMWCTKYRPQVLKELIVNDQHSPEEFRIRGSLSNSPEFSKDFQCPIGSKMNPIKKCSVW
ncbi:neprilysin-2-like [Leptopilina heterotoma]|uniref:neprilysin-2-like n=1 Tax=Leptopilina heterotoma TaxID=63436 RepID=UPI001CAA348C|nr:neprilysin-2-like [Leptopilina heterotoma]